MISVKCSYKLAILETDLFNLFKILAICIMDLFDTSNNTYFCWCIFAIPFLLWAGPINNDDKNSVILPKQNRKPLHS